LSFLSYVGLHYLTNHITHTWTFQ